MSLASVKTAEKEEENERQSKSVCRQERRLLARMRMKTKTVSFTTLSSTGFRYFYSVCFIRLFGPSGL